MAVNSIDGDIPMGGRPSLGEEFSARSTCSQARSRRAARAWDQEDRNPLPRILVISNNPFSETSSNGKTLTSFFQGYPADRLAQLYFSDWEPSATLCTQFFRVSDNDMVRRLLRKEAHRESRPRVDGTASSALVRGVRDGKHRKYEDFARLGREGLWRTGLWRTLELDVWLDEFNPELVLFLAGDACFAYTICKYVADRTGSKICLYVTDDYVLPRRRLSPLWWIRRRLVDFELRNTLERAVLFVTISEAMRDTYLNKYGRDSVVAANEAPSLAVQAKPNPPNEPLIVTYAGGLHFNRARTLASLGRAIAVHNEEHGGRASAMLKIYSSQIPPRKALKSLNIPDASEFCGALDPIGVQRVLTESDVLVHVESFDRKSREATRLSLSTKIPEYLSFGKPILAIGPPEVASMRHLANVALCVTALSDLPGQLANLLLSSETRDRYSALARSKHIENHCDASDNKPLLRSLLDAFRSASASGEAGRVRD